MTAPIPSGPQVIVEIGFSGPGTGTSLHLDDGARGRLDTNTLAPDNLWTDVSQWVVSVSTRRGATRADGPSLRYEAGTATIVLRNEDRRFDPTNLAGPYVAGGTTQVEPMRAARIRAAFGTTYPLWQGYADNWQVEYDGPTGSVVTLTCSDAFAAFASYDRSEQAPVGAGEDSGARVNRILDSISWAAGDRMVATGDSTLQATTLSANVLTELLLVADSEGGEFYMDTRGRAAFRNRLALFEQTRSITPQGVFGDDETSPTELPYADVTLSYDAQSIYNLISIARAGGTAQVAEDPASRTAYLTRSYTRTDLLLQTDTETADFAGYLLLQGSEPELRFSAMQLRPQRDPRLWAQALGREIGDRVTVIRRPPGGGAPIQRDVFVRGVEHTLDQDLSWTTTFQLQSATRGQFLVLDNVTLGQLDNNGLAY